MFKALVEFLAAHPNVRATAQAFAYAVVTAVLFHFGLDNAVVAPVLEEAKSVAP